VERGDHRSGRSGSGKWQASTFKAIAPACVSSGPMGWPPWASIERTDHMLLFMGPISLVACHRQKLGLSLLLHWLVSKRNWVWTHGSVSRQAVDCVGSPFFLGAVGSVQIYWCLMNGCYMWTMWDTYGLGPYVDRVWKVCDVLVGLSPAGCTLIRTATTLRYE
jgi:hypothetical protein